MNRDCALHAIDQQLSDRTPLERMRVVAGTLLDMLPRGRTFALCDECEQAVRGASGKGQFFRITDQS
jgi:hypothetical protein